MTDWIAAEKRADGLAMWAMPEGTPTDTAGAEMVLAGGRAAPRALPCHALHGALVRGEGGWLMAPLESGGMLSGGAEARIAGYVADRPNWDGVICWAGPCTVWAHVSAGEVISFLRFESPRLAAAFDLPGSWDAAAFAARLADTMARPERLAAELARAADAGALWGALAGAELAAARPYWLGQQVVLIGDGPGARATLAALEAQCAPVTRADDTEMLLAGLQAALERKEQD